MKLSEMQEILKEFQDKCGDVEIKLYYIDGDITKPINKNNFSGTAFYPEPFNIKYIQIWV